MWSAHQKKVVRLRIIVRPSSIYHSYQGQWQGRQLLSPPMIPTCRPAHSMCWLLWPWVEHTKCTAPNQRRHLSRLQFRRPQWMWVPLKAVRQRTQQRMMPYFILMMNPDEFIGIFLRATPLTPLGQEMSLSLRALPPHRRLREDKKWSWAWECFSQNRGVSQHTCYACDQPLPAKKSP